MQLMNTQSPDAITGFASVESRGDGGETITVRLVDTVVVGDAAVIKAKSIMVQLATFSNEHAVDEIDRVEENAGDDSSVGDGREQPVPAVTWSA